MDGLVWIGKVTQVFPIEGAERIESLEVYCGRGGRWRGTAVKGQFQVGDLCQVYLQDSLVPQTPELAFMEKYHWRVGMRRFLGVPSEVLITTQTVPGGEGDDVTEAAGVTKYEKPIPITMRGEVRGGFPSFIPKTEEPNFQAAPEMVEALRQRPFYSTVKCDGSSATIYRRGDHFGCCSRNLELKDTPNNVVWQLAHRYHLPDTLPDGWAIQLEVVGPGIQGNPMGLKQVDVRLFSLYDLEARRYLGGAEVKEAAQQLQLPMVEVVDWGRPFEFRDDEELRRYAEGLYPNGRQREGVVIRPLEETAVDGRRLSFKVVNLLYKEAK
ncbi:MAG: RNA ligase family protein [Chloroflexota bacterium]